MVKETKIGMIESQIPTEELDNLESYAMDHVSALDIPENEKIPGYEIGFIALKVMGQDQKENWHDAYKKGYRPVLASEHPKLAARFMGPPMPGETVVDDYIRYNDLLMMKIPTALHNKLQIQNVHNQESMMQKANWSNQTRFNERGFQGFDHSGSDLGGNYGKNARSFGN